jgi:glycopeptide antibiotics resistance protein
MLHVYNSIMYIMSTYCVVVFFLRPVSCVIMSPSGATCLSADCCFCELSL